MFRLILVLFAAIGLPGPAHACTYFDFNIYQAFYEPNIVRLAREAKTVDWVAVKATEPQRCPRFPDPTFERDKYLAAVEAYKDDSKPPAQETCRPGLDPEPGMFVAHVIERLKGQSTSTFDLYQGADDGSDMRFGFGDVRELTISAAYRFNRNQRIEAEGRHASFAYWHRAVVDMPLDGTTSCGGRPAFSSSLRYIVFRDAQGAVMSYAPVKHQDDVLLTRLRGLRQNPEMDIRTPMRVEDYFRQTSDLVLGRIVRCTADDDGSDRSANRARRGGVISVERGVADFLEDGNSDIYAPLEKNEASFEYLTDHFKYRREGCTNGGRVLIASLNMSDAADMYSSWNLVDHLMNVAARVLDPEYGAYQFAPMRAWFPDQPIRVLADGRVRLSDIQSGLRLEGPESVSVDDIFRWHEDGRALRERR